MANTVEYRPETKPRADKNKQKRAWCKRRQEALPKIPCQCGCGTQIPNLTINKDSAHYVKGHNGRGRRGQIPWNKGSQSPAERFACYRAKAKERRLSLPRIECHCGCGEMIPPITSQGRAARYKQGHQPGHQPTQFRKGQKAWNRGKPAPWSRETHLGRKRSNETKLRIGTAGRGRPAWNKGLSGLPGWNKGRPHPTKRLGGTYSTAIGGIRPDLGQYFRSSWESNYARYLRYIGRTYTYEPQCFIVTLPDGSQHAYRPDFLVDGSAFVELRGPYHRGLKTAHKDAVLVAAANQLPFPLTVLRTPEYAALHTAYRFIIPHWEYPKGPRFGANRLPCPTCGDLMRDKSAKQKYCSRKCQPHPFTGRKLSQDAITRRNASRRANKGGRY